jgi:hypothetical protein
MRTLEAVAMLSAFTMVACDSDATVVLDNRYPSTSGEPQFVYRAQFMQAQWDTAVPPQSSSVPESTLETSGDWAYVLLAPGWDARMDAGPQSFVVLKSYETIAAGAGKDVRIAIDDTTFRGRCAAGSFLTQVEADAITNAFFSDALDGFVYNASDCTTTKVSDGGAP